MKKILIITSLLLIQNSLIQSADSYAKQECDALAEAARTAMEKLELDFDDQNDIDYAISLMQTENVNREFKIQSGLTRDDRASLQTVAKALMDMDTISDDNTETIQTYLNPPRSIACETQVAPQKPKKEETNQQLVERLRKERNLIIDAERAAEEQLTQLEEFYENNSELLQDLKRTLTTLKARHPAYKPTEAKIKSLEQFLKDLSKKELSELRKKVGDKKAAAKAAEKKPEACAAPLERKPKPKAAEIPSVVVPLGTGPVQARPSRTYAEMREQLEALLPIPKFLLEEIKSFQDLDNTKRYDKIKQIAETFHNYLLGTTDVARMASLSVLKKMKERLVYEPGENGLIAKTESLKALFAFEKLTPSLSLVQSYIDLYIELFSNVITKQNMDSFIDLFMQDDCKNFATLDYATIYTRASYIANGLLNIYEDEEPMFDLLLDSSFQEALKDQFTKTDAQKIAALEKAKNSLKKVARKDLAHKDRFNTLQELLIGTGIWEIPGLHNKETPESLIHNQLFLLERINYFAQIHKDIYSGEIEEVEVETNIENENMEEID